MLKNNGKIIIGRNFLFCLCIVGLMFTALGFGVENSFALDLNETVDEIGLESDDTVKLENSQTKEMMGVGSQDSNETLQATHTPSGNTYQSIKDAIEAASAGDTIKLSGTYYSNGNQIVINKKLNIISDNLAILDGKHLSYAFQINEKGAGTTFKNLKFINGEGTYGSAMTINAKNVHVTDCIFEDNHGTMAGAIYGKNHIGDASGAIVDNCQFRRNSCYSPDFSKFSCAAALALFSKDSEVKNSIFEDNWVASNVDCFGAAIQIGLDVPASNAKVTNCVFRNNSATSYHDYSHGGAGCVRTGTLYSNCIFIDNKADRGGALTFHASGKIINCTFIDNKAELYGGAISTGFLYDYMELNVVDCNFDGNTAPLGGAIQAKGLNIIVDDSNFKNNVATEYGGAINIEAEDVTVKDSVFNSNKAHINGGAVYIKGKNTHVQNSSFLSNDAIPDIDKLDDGLGGAIYVDSSKAFIADNNFRFNTARNGSAIYYGKTGEKLTLTNNELYQNQAWVYHLPIYAEDIYHNESEKIRVVLFGGNNIAKFNNLAVSNAIYNGADNVNIVIDDEYPVDGATDSGDLYQDSREYNIDVSLSVQHEDGTVVYNKVGHTNYLGEILVDLDDLKPGKYYVTAKHLEDTYYKGITNQTTFRVIPKVDNVVTKSVSKSVADFEDVVTWTITVRNNGPSNSTEVKVSDLLPEGLIWLSDTSKGKYDPKSGELDIGNLSVGETFSFDISTVIDKTGEIVNRVNVTSHEFDSNTTNNYDEKSIVVNPAADLAVTKSVSNEKPNYFDHITWTIEISNNGPDTANNVEMHDVLPEALIYVDCDRDYDAESGIWKVGSLKSGEKAKINIQCIVNKTGLIENTVRVNATEYDYDLANNNDSERIFVGPASDLAIIKTVNASVLNFNDLVKWTLTISNNGPDRATNVRVIDELPDGFSYVNSTMTKGSYSDDVFEIDKIDVGEVVVIEIITLVEKTGNSINFANVTSDNYDVDPTNNEDNESVFVKPAADLSVEKTVSESNPDFNDIITWTIEIVNNGPDIAHNIVARDLLPESLIWIEDDGMGDYDHLTGTLNIDELDVDETYVLNIDCRVNGTGIIQNNVTVDADEYDYNITNNFDNETIEVEKSADVSVIKSVNNSSPNYNDLVTWTLVISNAGPDKATNVFIEDALPEGLILVNYTATKGIYDKGMWVMCCLEKGEVQRLEIVSRVNRTGKITNVATINADEYDSNQTNNVDNESIDVPLAVDLQVVIEVNNTNPIFAEKVNWMITVTNNGPDNATGVVLEDILPDGLVFVESSPSVGSFGNDVWNIGSVNVGKTVTLNITTIPNELGNIVNDVKVGAAEYDWNMSNNHDSDEIDVRPVADLSIEKLVDRQSPKYGETVMWTLIVKNNGPNKAHNVIVEDMLPEGLKFVKSNGDYSKGIWRVGNLDVGEVKSLKITCKVTSTGDFVNIVSAKSDELDLNESNNKANSSIHVASAADLSITKLASKYNYRVGDVVEYEIEVVNNGPDTARNIKVSEILDKLLKLKSFKASKGKFNKFTKIWTIDSLGYGESAKLIIRVIAVGSGVIKNTVALTSDTFDYDMSNNDDFAVVNVTEKPSNNVSVSHNGNSDKKPLTNLQMHPTANPIWTLLVSMLLSIVCFGGNISKKH